MAGSLPVPEKSDERKPLYSRPLGVFWRRLRLLLTTYRRVDEESTWVMSNRPPRTVRLLALWMLAMPDARSLPAWRAPSRSEERRVGKEGVGQWRYGWSP